MCFRECDLTRHKGLCAKTDQGGHRHTLTLSLRLLETACGTCRLWGREEPVGGLKIRADPAARRTRDGQWRLCPWRPMCPRSGGEGGGGWKRGAAGFCGWCEVLQPLMQMAHSSPAHETEGLAGVAGWGERFPQAFEASRDPTSREETVKLRPETGGH